MTEAEVFTELWSSVESALSLYDCKITPECASDLRSLVMQGATQLSRPTSTDGELAQAKRELDRLIRMMRSASEDIAFAEPDGGSEPAPLSPQGWVDDLKLPTLVTTLHEYTLTKARKSFCPCFPFCS